MWSSVIYHRLGFADVARIPDAFRIDVGLRPKRFQKLVLCHQAIGMLDQVAQHIERLGRKGRTFIVPPQTVVDDIKPE